MAKHHLIISGTGRTGTTFLVQLFTALGLDTGFTDITSAVLPNCNAGMEWDISHPDAPYIIKSPLLCDNLDEVLEGRDIIIDHAIIPVRDLYAAAESRRDVNRRTTNAASYPGDVPGGVWHSERPEPQEVILANQLYKIIYTLAKRDIPTTLLYFPRLVNDWEYLYRKVEFALKGISREKFLEAYTQVARPELVHVFKPTDEANALSKTGGATE